MSSIGAQHSVKWRISSESEDDSESRQLLQSESTLGSSSAKMSLARTTRLQRVTTPEMEMIERGRQNNVQEEADDDDDDEDDPFIASDGSLSTVEDEVSICGEEMPVKDKHPEAVLNNGLDVNKYMAKREMSPLQERVNAITVMPSAFFCFYFLLSGSWLDPAVVDTARDEILNEHMEKDWTGCISSSWFPNLHALPPLPVLAAALGIILHAPCSFVYHWTYAHRLPPGLARTTHWSRRLDHVMIHFISATMSYATSGSFNFFMANLLFNLDCMYRQFDRQVRPRRNQIRIGISIMAYMIPLLNRGELFLFAKLMTVFVAAGWFFLAYPVGGWSHSIFHLIIAIMPPLVMSEAMNVPASQDQIRLAAQCAVWKE
jgi:hypothetical protein